ncbi:MAG: DUF5069 domain-containing protein [Chthoniobacterales bacterium]
MSFPKSPYEKTGGIYYFARMCDKIRLQAKGELPADYHDNLGKGFDLRCTDLLHACYKDVDRLVRKGMKDDEVLQWCFSESGGLSEDQIMIWNEFMRKRGWNDEAAEILQRRKKEGGFENRTDIVTMFDFIDLDEGRDPAKR